MTYLEAGAQPRAVPSSRKRLVPPLVWRRLPWYSELLIVLVGYALYTRSRVAAPSKEQVALFHSKQVADLQQVLHIDFELVINRVVAAWNPLADAVGYYYGTLHFVITPLVLVWLWKKRPAAYPRLRSSIMITTVMALAVYWTWPLAPPRFAMAGAVDIVTRQNIFGAADPHGISNMVNLYAAMPSLHVAWATWAAVAVYVTTSGRWRRLVWLYPLATTLVVLGSANHYLLDAVGGVAIVAIGLLLTRPRPEHTLQLEPEAASIAAVTGRDTLRADATVPPEHCG